MESMILNWKTSSAGLGAILSAAVDIYAGFKTGDTSRMAADVGIVFTGIVGLMAKDKNVIYSPHVGTDVKQ